VTVTGARVLLSVCVEKVLAAAGAGVTLCAHPETETANISAPSGSKALSDDWPETAGVARGEKPLMPAVRLFLLRAIRAARAEGCAKVASKQGPAMRQADRVQEKLGWLEITERDASWLARKDRPKFISNDNDS